VRRLVAEFLGTYMLMFTVGCNVLAASDSHAQQVFAAISIASVLMVTIYAMGMSLLA
jgi:glycerol uptake facilitator-like aquaporin